MVGKAEVLAKSTKDFEENKEIYFTIDPNDIHLMKKPDTQNLFIDALITKNNQLELDDDILVDIDVTKLVANSKVDEDGYLVVNNKKYDLTDADVTVNIDMADIEISDDQEAGNITGQIVSMIYRGDHYQVIVRTEDGDDFVLDTEWMWNENDLVSIKINPDKIKLTLKGDITKYEI